MMMRMKCRIGLSLLVVAALAACLAEAGVRDLRNKYRNLVSQEGGLMGGGSSAAASASSAGVSSAVAAGYGGHSASRRGAHHSGAGGLPFVPQPQPHYAQHQPQSQAQYYQAQAPAYARAPLVGAYRQPAQYRQPPAYYQGAEGGLIEEPAWAPNQYSAHYGVPPPMPQPQQHQQYHESAYGNQAGFAIPPYQYAQPPRRQRQRAHQQRYAAEPAHFVQSPRAPAAFHPSPGAATSSAAAAVGGGSASAAASASGGSIGGHGNVGGHGGHGINGGHGGQAAASSMGAAASSATGYYQAPAHDRRTMDEEVKSEHYYEPETVEHYEAQAGTFGNGAGATYEQGSYVRDTESLEKHEDGREDGDHYYQAQAYGKTKDVNNHVAYNNDDEDILHTPNMFRKKKSNTNYVSNFNKQHRETGSGVTAHDKHSASYNKNSKKLKENVDQRFSKGADGVVQTKAFDSHADVDDEDEEAMDTRGLGNFVGVDGVLHGRRAQPNNPAAAAAAAATASFKAPH